MPAPSAGADDPVGHGVEVRTMPTRRIPVAEPVLAGNERAYVLDCLDSGWISGSGKYVRQFEERFAEFCGAEHAVSVANGTVALHLAALALGIGPGDEVIIPDVTYIASPNSVVYCGGTPVFADIDRRWWTIDAADAARRVTPRTKAIMPVHLYGQPADMAPLLALARERRLGVLEDAAEAHGAEYHGRRIGGIGDVSTFSFFGNKVITCGEGGMITTNDAGLAEHMRLRRGQGMDPNRRYWFPVVGYNYRMTNVQAAIGLAQLERVDWFVDRRLEVADWYRRALADADFELPPAIDGTRSVYWLFSICVPRGVDRDRVMQEMDEAGVETRPFFHPMHTLPPYHDPAGDTQFPVSTDLAARGINLPSSASLTREDVAHIAATLKRCVERQRPAVGASD